MNKDEFLDNIEEYLNGHLTTTQAAAFEQAMKEDAELQEAFQKRKETVNALKELFAFESKKEEFKQLIEAMKQEEREQANKVRPLWQRFNRQIAAVLAIALFLGVAYFAYQYFTPPTYQQLALTAIEQTAERSLSSISETLSGVDKEVILVKEAVRKTKKAYQQAEFTEAIKLSESVSINKEDKQYYNLVLLRMLCHLELENMDAATEHLQILQTYPHQDYEDRIGWYSAVIELYKGKPNNITKAKQQLQAIVSEGGTFRKEAQELLNKL